MPQIIIQGTPINFPNDGASPDWSPAIIQFAESVATALSNVVGTYDVSPQQFILTNIPNDVSTSVPNLSFSPDVVNGAIVTYSIQRITSSVTVSETGMLTCDYNPTNTPGELWQLVRESDGNSNVTFTMSDEGQISITLSALAGTPGPSFVSYYGKAIQNSY
jgi:hypothetical protein